MSDITFGELEHTGWQNRADNYDAGFNTVSRAVFPDILTYLGTNLSGRRVLDVCCGTGELSAALAALGAKVIGIDFSEAMLSVGKSKFPLIEFQTGNAENLRIDAGRIDDVVCAFGLLHMSNPDAAVAEAARVLKPGGRYVYTVWNGPEQGGGFLDVVVSAIAELGTLEMDLPPAPPPFRFADPDEAFRVLNAAGFQDIVVRQVEPVWRPATGHAVLEMIYKSMVRAPMMLNAQTPEDRVGINARIVEQSEEMRDGDALAIPTPATIVTATKPAR